MTAPCPTVYADAFEEAAGQLPTTHRGRVEWLTKQSLPSDATPEQMLTAFRGWLLRQANKIRTENTTKGRTE